MSSGASPAANIPLLGGCGAVPGRAHDTAALRIPIPQQRVVKISEAVFGRVFACNSIHATLTVRRGCEELIVKMYSIHHQHRSVGRFNYTGDVW